MQKLGQEVRDLAPKYGMTATEATKALYQIYSAGYKGAEGIEVLKASLTGAAAGLTDVFTAADATTSILNAYRMSADKAAYVNDVLFKVVERGKTTFGELASGIGRLIGIAAPLGATFEEVSAAISTLTRQGIATDEAITSIRQAIIQLARPTEQTAEVIEALGYSSGQAMIQELGFAQALAEVTTYAKEHNISLMDMFTNVRALLTVLPLAGDSAQEYAEDMEEIANATGSAAAAFEKQQGLAFRLKQVKAQFAEIATALGEAFLPALTQVLDVVQSLLGPLATMGETLRDIITILGTASLGALFGGMTGAAIGGAIGGLVILAGMIKDIVAGIKDLSGGITPPSLENFESQIEQRVDAILQERSTPPPPGTPWSELDIPLFYQLFPGADEVQHQSEVLQQSTEDVAQYIEETSERIAEAARQIAEEMDLPSLDIEPRPALTIEETAQAIADLVEEIHGLPEVTEQQAEAAEEAAAAASEAVASWQEELDKIIEQIAEDPIEAADAVAQFIQTFQGIPGAMLAGADAAETLVGILEDWLALPAEMRAGAGVSDTDVENMIETLKGFTVQIEETKTRQEAWAKQWESWTRQLDDGTITIEEFIGIVQDHMRANVDDAEQLMYHYQRLQELESRYEMLVPILESLGFSSEEAESAARALANALGTASSAAKSLAAQLNALSLSNIADIIPRAQEIVEKLRTGDVEDVGEWLELWGQLQGLKAGAEAFREGVYRVGAGVEGLREAVDAVKEYLDSVTSGKTPEEIAEEQRRAAEEAEREAKRAEREAQRARQRAAREAERAAEEAARRAQEEFRRQFDLPALGALATGDWEGAAKAIQGMAQMYDQLVAEAAALAEVNGRRIEEDDVLQLLVGAERKLLAALRDRIRLAELAGDFDLVTELQEQYDAIEKMFAAPELPEGLQAAFDEIKETWREDATKAGERLRQLAEGFDPALVAEFIDGLVSEIEDEIEIMEKFGQDTTEATKALNDLQVAVRGGLKWWEKAQEKLGWAAQGLDILNDVVGSMGDIPRSIAAAFSGARTVIDNLFKGDVKEAIISGFQSAFAFIVNALQEKKAELERTLDFYISSFERLGSAISGIVQSFSLGLGGPVSGMFGALMSAIISAIKMTFLSGLELLAEGINMLVGFIGQLANSFANLIKQSEAYSALKKEADSVWKAIADLLGEFLWPLVAIIRYLKEWLGIQEKANRLAMSNLNVPIGWKVARIRYGASTPGEPIVEAMGEVEVPEWADAIGKKIAEYIMGLLQEFGIDSWGDLMEQFRNAAIGVWEWLTRKMPDIIRSVSEAIKAVGAVLEKYGVSLDSIADWLARGVDWLIQNLPQLAADVAEFIVQLFELGREVWSWFIQNFPSWDDIRAAFNEFMDELDKLPSWDEVEGALDTLNRTLNALKLALIYTIMGATGALIGALAAMNPVMGWAAMPGAIAGLLAGIGLAALIQQWIGSFAEGGIVMKPGFARIGEAGPEAIVPLSRLPEFMGKASAGGPFIINVHVGSERVARVVLKELKRDNNVASGYNLAPLGV